MKTNSLQSMFENRWRSIVAMLAIVGLSCAIAGSGSAQLKNQKRVTALQLGESPEGARVTIVSDSALNDYEAFRRGDRFYVKIPIADLAAAMPSLHGNGFEDMRAQRVGDSVIVSFKLQPGTTARVDQRSNRLDVIFSVAGLAKSVPAQTANNSFPASRNRRNSDSEGTAGPLPPMSPNSAMSPTSPSRTQQPPARNSNSDSSFDNSSYNFGPTRTGRATTGRNVTTSGASNRTGNFSTEKFPASAKTTSPATPSLPASTPTSIGSPSPSAFASPVPSYTPQSVGVPVSAGSRTSPASSWESRVNFLKAWAKLNRTALIVGGLIFLALLAGLLLRSRMKGRKTVPAKVTKKSTSKPVVEKVQGHQVIEAEPLVERAAPVMPKAAAPAPKIETSMPQPATAAVVLPQPREHRELEQDREVFEL